MASKKSRVPLLRPTDPVSPLRYPGGKALLASYISGVIEENYLCGCTFYEPYAGGASVSLQLLRLGFIDKAVLVERDPLVYAFWKSAIQKTEELCEAVMCCEITLDTWKALLPAREIKHPTKAHDIDIVSLGLAGLFFNRTNFSGIMGAGPIGGMSQSSAYKIDCRFNKESICRQIRAVGALKGRIEIKFDDALSFLRRNAEKISAGFSLVYVDPPYYAQGRKLYRYYYGDEQHVDLAEFITNQGYPWLLSYDDHPRIRELYADNRMQPIYLDYKVKSNRTAQELLISNLVIPPPIYPTDPPSLEYSQEASAPKPVRTT
jgi:DNA adenine methylase